jgi:hypothetical protein
MTIHEVHDLDVDQHQDDIGDELADRESRRIPVPDSVMPTETELTVMVGSMKLCVVVDGIISTADAALALRRMAELIEQLS